MLKFKNAGRKYLTVVVGFDEPVACYVLLDGRYCVGQVSKGQLTEELIPVFKQGLRAAGSPEDPSSKRSLSLRILGRNEKLGVLGSDGIDPLPRLGLVHRVCLLGWLVAEVRSYLGSLFAQSLELALVPLALDVELDSGQAGRHFVSGQAADDLEMSEQSQLFTFARF